MAEPTGRSVIVVIDFKAGCIVFLLMFVNCIIIWPHCLPYLTVKIYLTAPWVSFGGKILSNKICLHNYLAFVVETVYAYLISE